MIGHLLAGAVDDMSDFVGHYKLLVLSGKAVSDEESVFDLDCPDHILRELVIHLAHRSHLLGHRWLSWLHEVLWSHLLLRLLEPHVFLLYLKVSKNYYKYWYEEEIL